MTNPTARAQEHLDQIKRRTPHHDVHIRMLLGDVLDILAAQQAEIAALRAQVADLRQTLPPMAPPTVLWTRDAPPTRCPQRDEWAIGAKVPA